MVLSAFKIVQVYITLYINFIIHPGATETTNETKRYYC